MNLITGFFAACGIFVVSTVLTLAAAFAFWFVTAFLLCHISDCLKLKSDSLNNNGSLLAGLAGFIWSIYLCSTVGPISAFFTMVGALVCIGVLGLIAWRRYETLRLRRDLTSGGSTPWNHFGHTG